MGLMSEVRVKWARWDASGGNSGRWKAWRGIWAAVGVSGSVVMLDGLIFGSFFRVEVLGSGIISLGLRHSIYASRECGEGLVYEAEKLRA